MNRPRRNSHYTLVAVALAALLVGLLVPLLHADDPPPANTAPCSCCQESFPRKDLVNGKCAGCNNICTTSGCGKCMKCEGHTHCNCCGQMTDSEYCIECGSPCTQCNRCKGVGCRNRQCFCPNPCSTDGMCPQGHCRKCVRCGCQSYPGQTEDLIPEDHSMGDCTRHEKPKDQSQIGPYPHYQQPQFSGMSY
jgi:hypothetical protein